MIVVDMEKAFRISLIINIILFILFGTMTVLFITKKTACPKQTTENQKYGLKNIVITEANIPFKSDQYTYDVYLEDETIDKINIKATPYNDDAEINISGNHGLAGGNKKVTITVYDIDNKEYEYIINLNKKCITENKSNENSIENQEEQENT